jgi:hypothetical protein
MVTVYRVMAFWISEGAAGAAVLAIFVLSTLWNLFFKKQSKEPPVTLKKIYRPYYPWIRIGVAVLSAALLLLAARWALSRGAVPAATVLAGPVLVWLPLEVWAFWFAIWGHRRPKNRRRALEELKTPLLALTELPPRGRQEAEPLISELVSLGFVPSGFYQLPGWALYVVGLTHTDLRIYASVTITHTYPPYTDLTSLYQDGGLFTVIATPKPEDLERPPHHRVICQAGARPTVLLELMLNNRPPQGLLETPPDDFKEAAEQESREVIDYTLSRELGN